MLKRSLPTLTLLCLMSGTLYAADDAFVGKWKLNSAKSNVDGEQLKIEDLGGNKYKITSHNASSTITADGTDQPDQFGTTTSIALLGSNAWRMVVKRNGKIAQSMTYTFSQDGTIQIKGANTRPDGSTLDWDIELKRVGSGSGWTGTWEEVKEKTTFPHELDIEAYKGEGLTFKSPDYLDVLNMRFDGKDYGAVGPDKRSDGALFSGKRLDEHSFKLTYKLRGHVVENRTYLVSPDGKTLTIKTIEAQASGQQHEQVSVYDKLLDKKVQTERMHYEITRQHGIDHKKSCRNKTRTTDRTGYKAGRKKGSLKACRKVRGGDEVNATKSDRRGRATDRES